MSEHRNASARRLLALSRYISALEQGDIDTLAAVLSEASYDPTLSALLEELDSVYQAIDGTAVSAQEARQAFYSVFSPGQNSHLAWEQESTLIQHTTPLTPAQSVTPLPGVMPSYERKKQRTLMEEQPTQPFSPIKTQRQASARPRQQGRVLHPLVAFLVVCALVGSMALGLHELHPNPGAGSTASPPPGSPTSLIWGKTLYTKPLDSIASNAASIAWSPDSKRVAGLTFDGVQIWDATTGAHWMISKAPDNFGILQNIAWSPNGEWIAVAAETGIAIVNAHSGALVHGYSITSLATSASRTLSVPHGSPLDTLLPTSGGGSFVSSLAWSPDSSQLAVTDYLSTTGRDNFVIMNARTGSLVQSFEVPADDNVTVASWSPDGKYLATSITSANLNNSDEASVWVWDTSTHQPVMQRSTNGGGGSPMAAGEFAWQPKSDNLLFAEGNISNLRYGWEAPTIALWNVTQNKLLKQYRFENTGIFAWSPNGQYFATGSYANQPATDQSTADQVAIIDAQSGQQIYAYNQNDGQVLNLVWSPNGQYIASCGPSSVKVWTAL